MKLDEALRSLSAAADEAAFLVSDLSARNRRIESELAVAKDKLRRAANALKALRVDLKNGGA